jgi:hypothetical protein
MQVNQGIFRSNQKLQLSMYQRSKTTRFRSVIVRLPSPRLLARTTTSVFLLQITWEPGRPIKCHCRRKTAARDFRHRANPRHSDGRTECAVNQELPSVTSVGDAERSNASGGVRLVSGRLKPEAHLVRRQHVACVSGYLVGQPTCALR